MVGLGKRVKSGLLEEFQVTSEVKPYALNCLNLKPMFATRLEPAGQQQNNHHQQHRAGETRGLKTKLVIAPIRQRSDEQQNEYDQ